MFIRRTQTRSRVSDQKVALDSLELADPRSVGVGRAALSATRQCGFEDKLSELATHAWLLATAVDRSPPLDTPHGY